MARTYYFWWKNTNLKQNRCTCILGRFQTMGPCPRAGDSIKHKVEFFFNSLTEEKENFALSLSDLLQYKLLVTEEEKETIIGIAGLRKKNMFFLVVKSEYQNRGIGQKLTRKVIQKAALSKYDYIALSVFQSNTKAVHIYQKLGFKTGFTSLMDGRKNLFMVLPLNWRGIFIVAKCKLKSLYLIGAIIYRIVKAIRTIKRAQHR